MSGHPPPLPPTAGRCAVHQPHPLPSWAPVRFGAFPQLLPAPPLSLQAAQGSNALAVADSKSTANSPGALAVSNTDASASASQASLGVHCCLRCMLALLCGQPGVLSRQQAQHGLGSWPVRGCTQCPPPSPVQEPDFDLHTPAYLPLLPACRAATLPQLAAATPTPRAQALLRFQTPRCACCSNFPDQLLRCRLQPVLCLSWLCTACRIYGRAALNGCACLSPAATNCIPCTYPHFRFRCLPPLRRAAMRLPSAPARQMQRRAARLWPSLM